VLCEGPGYLGHFLDREGVPWKLVCLDEGIGVPQDLETVSGLVFMGGNMSVNDPLEWIAQEQRLIRRAHRRGLPMMGVCFGAQLISSALGGEVIRSPRGMEVGWHSLTRVPNCRCEGWLVGLPEEIHTFHWHGETFTAPPESRPLLESDCFHNQAFALGDSIGMQFHLEMTEEMVHNWIRQYGRKLDSHDPYTQRPEEMTYDLRERIQRLHQVADVIYGQWLERVRRRAYV
jgi:GMP synthase-like glutamine amidotransferase